MCRVVTSFDRDVIHVQILRVVAVDAGPDATQAGAGQGDVADGHGVDGAGEEQFPGNST